jgi:hypothetical protein
MSFVARKLIGFGCVALGLFALWASPVSTVSCVRGADGVSCTVSRAILAVVPIAGADVHHVRHAEVGHTSPPTPTSQTTSSTPPTNSTYELTFVTVEGRVTPRGVDASSAAPLEDIATQVNDLVSGDGGPFTARNYNGFPTVFGCIFLVLGAIIVVNG